MTQYHPREEFIFQRRGRDGPHSGTPGNYLQAALGSLPA
jgi:hypothetical protein